MIEPYLVANNHVIQLIRRDYEPSKIGYVECMVALSTNSYHIIILYG